MPLNISLAYNSGNPTPEVRQCIRYACDQWIAIIGNDLTINVRIDLVTMGGGFNAMCIPGLLQHNGQTLTRPQAKLNGNIDINDKNIDLVVVIDDNTNWVLDTGAGVQVAVDQYSLSTTIMHELCHGLGFLGLCNVNMVQQPNVGVYTNTNLIQVLNDVRNMMVPVLVIPNHFFPVNLANDLLTPFANLFTYNNPNLLKGDPDHDREAFTTPNSIIIEVGGNNFNILSQNPFQPFTTCDHIDNNAQQGFLMNRLLIGQYYENPDDASRQILWQIGWNIQ